MLTAATPAPRPLIGFAASSTVEEMNTARAIAARNRAALAVRRPVVNPDGAAYAPDHDFLVLVTAEDGEDVGTYTVRALNVESAIDAAILYARANGFRAVAGEVAEG